jgi:mevalonate pyrophosphate decarboxylase
VNDTNIPVAKAIFDTHSAVRAKTEAANVAVLEALQAMLDYQDPMAPAIFGADAETLKRLAETSKAKLNALCMTGVPIFSLRVASPEFKAILEGSGNEDAMLRVVLESFAQQLPITSL